MRGLALVVALFDISSEFLADMKVVKKGHIVNITSINERVANKFTVVYTGTKHFWTGMV